MKRVLLSLLLLAGFNTLIPLQAQDNVDANVDPDGQYEPGRAVARISVLNGDVSVRRGDSGEVVAAAVNGPLMADDRLLTSSTGRAEVQLDSANMIRIGPNSEVRFTGMDVKSFQVQVAMGTVTFRTLRPSQAQIEVDTPSVAVRPMRPGGYRVTVHEDGTSEITVRIGEAEVDSQRGGERLQAGQTMDARGPATDAEFQVVQPIPYDAFDRWNDDRDRFILSSQSYQHVSPAIGGTEDLDQNGRWVQDPNYGSVWQPTNVGPDWAPYQNGQWAWEDYYGWTWVSADPWGWAPYHYGRWFMGAGGWAWYPGPILGNPFWAPAYVGFFGFGGGFGVGVGFGFGGVGWVALAPFEAVHPWWGRGLYAGFRGGVFVNHTTIINNANVMSAYRNAGVRGGAIGVNAAGFGRGGSISSLNRTQLQSAGLVHGVVPVSPDRSSLRMSDRAVSGRYSQSSAQSFASRMQTPRVEHASFDQQQRGMQQMSRGNFSSPAGRGGVGGGIGGGASESAAHGWSRFGEPIHGTAGGSASPYRGNYSSGAARGYQRNDSSPYARGGSTVRINPSIVAPRSGSSPRTNTAPRSTGSSASRSSGGGGHSGGSGHGGGHR
jgi:FecR protein